MGPLPASVLNGLFRLFISGLRALGPDSLFLPNKALYDRLERNGPACIGQPCPDLRGAARDSVHSALAEVITQCRQVRCTDVQLAVEHGVETRDEHVALLLSPVCSGDGGAGGVLCMLIETTDITLARQHATRELNAIELARRIDEERLQTIIDRLPAGVGLTDAAGPWTLANASMRQYTDSGSFNAPGA
ncbi:PAS fold protein [Caballeronia temeraria]|uniref:PAS fold protein n=1 Tax=Caballeronia temeraria TaxID=1777137 RepID=A0A158DPH0_9BURK|nr:PAS domain-containing protein [Caballeronia temeraria]SAK96498.1 PAS fold protein [Caballeronia temeraria]